MKELYKQRAKGIKNSMLGFYRNMAEIDLNTAKTAEFIDMLGLEMKKLNFDSVKKDKSGNLIGVIKGFENKNSIVMISHIDIANNKQKGYGPGVAECKSGIISSIYAAALIKRTMLPMTGDLILCCVPKYEGCDHGIKYLFDNYFKSKFKKIKGVILCEPTDFNINLGHKGRMEYEIVVKGKLNRNFLENKGINMLGTMFPLINELEKASKAMPSDFKLGRSDLRIKDVKYDGYQANNDISEFRVVVDRVFIPEESEGFILNKAKTIAKTVFNQEPDITINTLLSSQRVKTHTGLELIAKKELMPWTMEGHNQFALKSLSSINENGFKSEFNYWKKIITEGSYTYGKMGIPTIGFGPGSEESSISDSKMVSMDKIERAVYGQAMIIQRNIGMPTFGWSSDDL